MAYANDVSGGWWAARHGDDEKQPLMEIQGSIYANWVWDTSCCWGCRSELRALYVHTAPKKSWASHRLTREYAGFDDKKWTEDEPIVVEWVPASAPEPRQEEESAIHVDRPRPIGPRWRQSMANLKRSWRWITVGLCRSLAVCKARHDIVRRVRNVCEFIGIEDRRNI